MCVFSINAEMALQDAGGRRGGLRGDGVRLGKLWIAGLKLVDVEIFVLFKTFIRATFQFAVLAHVRICSFLKKLNAGAFENIWFSCVRLFHFCRDTEIVF